MFILHICRFDTLKQEKNTISLVYIYILVCFRFVDEKFRKSRTFQYCDSIPDQLCSEYEANLHF